MHDDSRMYSTLQIESSLSRSGGTTMINIRMQNQNNRLKPRITVVGVGGAGGNAVNNMINSHLEGCEFLVCNTDAQALEGNSSPHKIQLGVNVTRGLGAGAN